MKIVCREQSGFEQQRVFHISLDDSPVLVPVLKLLLRRAHSQTHTFLASQYTAEYQMVQCFPYGRDTYLAHVRIQHCLLQQHPGRRNKVVIQTCHYTV